MIYLMKGLVMLIGIGFMVAPFLFLSSLNKGIKIPMFLIGLIALMSSQGFFYIPEKHSGQVTTTLGKVLPNERLIANTSEGERGLQDEIINPGYGYNWKYPFFMKIDIVPDMVVPAGQFAVLTARDGAINQAMVAEKWPENVDISRMLTDFDYYLENGGQRGIQQYILPTSIYRLNRHQWAKVELHKLKEVQANEVLVIESRFGLAPAFKESSDDEILSVPLVDSTDYRGIVNKAYPSGFYAVHPHTQKPHTVSIILETFIYGGGYNFEYMDLMIDADNDKLKTVKGNREVEIQKNGAAFEAKTKDNHTVRYDVRVLGQIEPIQAPRFIGTIKDPAVLDKKVIEPFTRNILSNITLGYTALELKDKKELIGELVSEELRNRTIKTGFRTKTVEITNIDIPAIVLIPGKIKSASIALKQALVEKEKSVEQAIKVRNMQDQADNQESLAQAIVARKAATEKAEEIKTLSAANKIKAKDEADAAKYLIDKQTEANKSRITEMANAYGALAGKIGKDNASTILLQETINESAEKYQGPEVVVYGAGSEGDTSIVDAHMMSKSMRDSVKSSVKQ